MSRAIDLIITYRVIKVLVTPFEKMEAYKRGIIDEKGKVLIKFKDVRAGDKKHYTILHRFCFNLKRILQKVGLGSRLGSFAVALALLIKEDRTWFKHKDQIESGVVSYLKDQNLYEEMLVESKSVQDINETPYMTCFGVDVFEKDGELISEFEYAKTL